MHTHAHTRSHTHVQSALRSVLWPALIIAAVRLVAIYIGSGVGCLATAASPEFRRNFWMSMVTQVGAT